MISLEEDSEHPIRIVQSMMSNLSKDRLCIMYPVPFIYFLQVYGDMSHVHLYHL